MDLDKLIDPTVGPSTPPEEIKERLQVLEIARKGVYSMPAGDVLKIERAMEDGKPVVEKGWKWVDVVPEIQVVDDYAGFIKRRLGDKPLSEFPILEQKKRATELTEAMKKEGLGLSRQMGKWVVFKLPENGLPKKKLRQRYYEEVFTFQDPFRGEVRVQEGKLVEEVGKTLQKVYEALLEEILRLNLLLRVDVHFEQIKKFLPEHPKHATVLPSITDPRVAESLTRIKWDKSKKDAMILWAKKLHELNLVEESPDEILQHCVCDNKVFDANGNAIEPQYSPTMGPAKRLTWKKSGGLALLMMSFLTEKKVVTKADPIEQVVEMEKGKFYCHFYVKFKRMDRALTEDESSLLGATQKTHSLNGKTYFYWGDKSPLFDFLVTEVSGNASNLVGG